MWLPFFVCGMGLSRYKIAPLVEEWNNFGFFVVYLKIIVFENVNKEENIKRVCSDWNHLAGFKCSFHL
jgi:hypothetical protein